MSDQGGPLSGAADQDTTSSNSVSGGSETAAAAGGGSLSYGYGDDSRPAGTASTSNAVHGVHEPSVYSGSAGERLRSREGDNGQHDATAIINKEDGESATKHQHTELAFTFISSGGPITNDGLTKLPNNRNKNEDHSDRHNPDSSCCDTDLTKQQQQEQQQGQDSSSAPASSSSVAHTNSRTNTEGSAPTLSRRFSSGGSPQGVSFTTSTAAPVFSIRNNTAGTMSTTHDTHISSSPTLMRTNTAGGGNNNDNIINNNVSTGFARSSSARFNGGVIGPVSGTSITGGGGTSVRSGAVLYSGLGNQGGSAPGGSASGMTGVYYPTPSSASSALSGSRQQQSSHQPYYQQSLVGGNSVGSHHQVPLVSRQSSIPVKYGVPTGQVYTATRMSSVSGRASGVVPSSTSTSSYSSTGYGGMTTTTTTGPTIMTTTTTPMSSSSGVPGALTGLPSARVVRHVSGPVSVRGSGGTATTSYLHNPQPQQSFGGRAAFSQQFQQPGGGSASLYYTGQRVGGSGGGITQALVSGMPQPYASSVLSGVPVGTTMQVSQRHAADLWTAMGGDPHTFASASSCSSKYHAPQTTATHIGGGGGGGGPGAQQQQPLTTASSSSTPVTLGGVVAGNPTTIYGGMRQASEIRAGGSTVAGVNSDGYYNNKMMNNNGNNTNNENEFGVHCGGYRTNNRQPSFQQVENLIQGIDLRSQYHGTSAAPTAAGGGLIGSSGIYTTSAGLLPGQLMTTQYGGALPQSSSLNHYQQQHTGPMMMPAGVYSTGPRLVESHTTTSAPLERTEVGQPRTMERQVSCKTYIEDLPAVHSSTTVTYTAHDGTRNIYTTPGSGSIIGASGDDFGCGVGSSNAHSALLSGLTSGIGAHTTATTARACGGGSGTASIGHTGSIGGSGNVGLTFTSPPGEATNTPTVGLPGWAAQIEAQLQAAAVPPAPPPIDTIVPPEVARSSSGLVGGMDKPSSGLLSGL